MQKNRIIIPLLVIGAALLLAVAACKHEPLNPTVTPPDTPIGGVCDPNVVYFQNQVLPILISNCTEADCHNADDRQEGVVLTSYENLMSTVEHVRNNDWSENKLIESLQETDLEDRMPLNKAPLSSDQINLLKKWIEQGAVNNACDETAGVCDSIAGASYAAFVQPLIQTRCKGCHSGNNPQGGVKLSTYAEIKTQALNGKLYSSVTRVSSWMPNGGAKLDDCSLTKLRNWVDAGALEN